MLGLLTAIFLMVLLTYLPGFLALRSLGCSGLASVGFAPVVSTIAYILLGIILYNVGVFATWQLMVIPVFVVAAGAYAVSLCCSKRNAAQLASVGSASTRKRAASASGPEAAIGLADPKASEGADAEASTASTSRHGECLSSFGSCRLFNHHVDVRLLLVVLLVNVLIAFVVFIGTLDGPDSFSQNYDTGHHLSHVAAVVEFGNWSTLNVSLDGTGIGGFYPSVLHTYAALLVAALGVSSACALNATIFVLIALTFPMGMYLLAVLVLPSDKIAPLCAGLLSLAFPAFPWILIRFSALLANVVGFALMPLALALFIVALEGNVSLRDRALRMVLCVIAMAVISLAHPNTLFSAGVFLIPFCVHKIWDAYEGAAPDSVWARVPRWLAIGAFLLFCVIVWKTVHGLSAFQGVVEFYYSAKSTLPEAITGVLLMKFRWYSAIIPLAVLAAVGLFAALRTKGCRWLVAVYVFAAIQLIVCSSQDPSFLKSLLCGFWYNHDFRLMTSFAVCAMPVAGLGLMTVVRFIEGLVAKKRNRNRADSAGVQVGGDQSEAQADVGCAEAQAGADRAEGSILEAQGASIDAGFFQRTFGVSGVSVALIAIAFTLVCFPVGYSPSEGLTTRSLGQSMSKLISINDWEGGFTIYHSDEREFVREAVELLPDDALVMNFPYDGSAYSYGLDGLNTYFKTNATASEEGSAEYIVETRLCDIAWDPEVQAAAKELGITHVIQLDHGFGEGSSTLTREYYEEDWAGISSIDGSTEGFEEILARGDMRLDKIG